MFFCRAEVTPQTIKRTLISRRSVSLNSFQLNWQKDLTIWRTVLLLKKTKQELKNTKVERFSGINYSYHDSNYFNKLKHHCVYFSVICILMIRITKYVKDCWGIEIGIRKLNNMHLLRLLLTYQILNICSMFTYYTQCNSISWLAVIKWLATIRKRFGHT